MSSTPTTTSSSSSSNIGGGGGGQFGDTTYTKVFVGGLAWETQKDTMNKYFEQFGEILEAVVIYDKNTGRSKGYGFVTFKEAEAARKACEDPAPVIDGRRANCNLASLGLQRSRPSTPQHGRGRSFGGMKGLKIGFQQGGVGTAFSYTPTLPHYAIQQGIPFPLSGYSPYYPYPMSYYSSNEACGGSSNHYFVYGGVGNGTMGAANPNYYPYFHYGQSFDIQYPQQQQFQYPSASLHHFHGGHIPFTPLPPSQSGAIVTTALPPPTVQALAPHYSNQTNSLHPISSI